MSKKRVLIISLIVLFLIAIAIAVFWFLQKEEKQEEVSTKDWEPKVLSQLKIDDKVESLALSPDGETVAIGQYLKADLYNIESGELIHSFEFSHSVEDLEFSPDGKILGGGVTLGGVTLYDVETKEEIANFHKGYNSRLAFSPDGKTVATGNREGVVWLWDIESGEQVAEFEPEETDYSSVLRFSQDGNYIAYGNFSGNVYYWEVESKNLVYTFELNSIIDDISISPDGKTLAVIDSGRKVNLFDLTSGDSLQDLEAQFTLTGLAFSPNNEILIAGGNVRNSDKESDMAAVWNTSDWSLYTLKNPDEESDRIVVTDIDFSSDSKKAVFGTWEGFVYLWQIQE